MFIDADQIIHCKLSNRCDIYIVKPTIQSMHQPIHQSTRPQYAAQTPSKQSRKRTLQLPTNGDSMATDRGISCVDFHVWRRSLHGMTWGPALATKKKQALRLHIRRRRRERTVAPKAYLARRLTALATLGPSRRTSHNFCPLGNQRTSARKLDRI